MTTPNKGYISQLPLATTIGSSDSIVMDQVVNGAPTTRRATVQMLYGLRIVRVTATSYTVAPADLLLPTCIIMANASPSTLTIPSAATLAAANGGVAIPSGVNCMYQRYGSGTLTLSAAVGVTIRFSSSVTLKNQYSMGFMLLSDIANEWSIAGDFT